LCPTGMNSLNVCGSSSSGIGSSTSGRGGPAVLHA
jgi:hypothetical protein